MPKLFPKYFIIFIFSSIPVLFIKTSLNPNEDVLCLDFFDNLGISNTAGSIVGLCVGSYFSILSRFSITNILLLKLLRIFTLALRKECCYQEKTFFNWCLNSVHTN